MYVTAFLCLQCQFLLCTHGDLLGILQDTTQESPSLERLFLTNSILKELGTQYSRSLRALWTSHLSIVFEPIYLLISLLRLWTTWEKGFVACSYYSSFSSVSSTDSDVWGLSLSSGAFTSWLCVHVHMAKSLNFPIFISYKMDNHSAFSLGLLWESEELQHCQALNAMSHIETPSKCSVINFVSSGRFMHHLKPQRILFPRDSKYLHENPLDFPGEIWKGLGLDTKNSWGCQV